MMRAYRAMSVVGAAVLAACSSAPPKGTLATLHKVQPDLQDVKVEGGLDTAMQSYQRFLEETPETQRTPEAMRRLADLKIEKEYGLNGTGEMLELPAPQAAAEVGLKPDLQPINTAYPAHPQRIEGHPRRIRSPSQASHNTAWLVPAVRWPYASVRSFAASQRHR
jgi:cellulose synthase operon protein C